METFNVAVVLDCVDLTDDEVDAIFAELSDALPVTVDGVVTVSSPVEARDAEAAVNNLVETLRRILPGVSALRLDQDLVAISDIAVRTERSRESVRLFVEGRRGPGGFPPAIGVVGNKIRVWPWAVVVDWFRDQLGVDLGERGVPPHVAAAVDAKLAKAKVGAAARR